MRIVFGLAILFIHCCSYGQSGMADHLFINDSARTSLWLDAQGSYGTDNLTNQFINKFVYGGEIDSITKQIVSNDLSDINRVSGEMRFSVGGVFKPDSLFGRTDLSCYFNVARASYGRLDFSKDLYDLIFYGNQAFQGGAADMSIRYSAESFNKLVLGLDHSSGFWAGIGYYQGNSIADINTNNSAFYTAEDGSYINLGLQAQAYFSDTANQGLFANNGGGVGFDFGYRAMKGDQVIFRISVQDLGVIRWNKRSGQLSKDTVYNYQGFDINDLINNRVSFTNIEDTLGLIAKKRSFVRDLPFRLSFEKPMYFDPEHQVNPYYGINYVHRYHNVPEVYIGIGYHPSESTIIYGSIGYGGYYKMHLRAGTQLFLSDNFKIKIESFSLVNSLSQTGLGQSLHIGLISQF